MQKLCSRDHVKHYCSVQHPPPACCILTASICLEQMSIWYTSQESHRQVWNLHSGCTSTVSSSITSKWLSCRLCIWYSRKNRTSSRNWNLYNCRGQSFAVGCLTESRHTSCAGLSRGALSTLQKDSCFTTLTIETVVHFRTLTKSSRVVLGRAFTFLVISDAWWSWSVMQLQSERQRVISSIFNVFIFVILPTVPLSVPALPFSPWRP